MLQKSIVVFDHLRMEPLQKFLIENGIHVLAELIENEPVPLGFVVADFFYFIIGNKPGPCSQKIIPQPRNEHYGQSVDKLKLSKLGRKRNRGEYFAILCYARAYHAKLALQEIIENGSFFSQNTTGCPKKIPLQKNGYFRKSGDIRIFLQNLIKDYDSKQIQKNMRELHLKFPS